MSPVSPGLVRLKLLMLREISEIVNRVSVRGLGSLIKWRIYAVARFTAGPEMLLLLYESGRLNCLLRASPCC